MCPTGDRDTEPGANFLELPGVVRPCKAWPVGGSSQVVYNQDRGRWGLGLPVWDGGLSKGLLELSSAPLSPHWFIRSFTKAEHNPSPLLGA